MTTKNMSYKHIFLSYPLDQNTPAYGGGEGARIISTKSIAHNDSCNTSNWSFSNHLSTHLDFPRHFVENGKTMDDYDPEFFFFNRVGSIVLSGIGSGEILTWQHLKKTSISKDIEILLIKTGFCEKRSSSIYWKCNPGFHPDLANELRDAFPFLRVLGFDSISLSSFSNRELGREAHKSFLDHTRPILLLEDMNLIEISEATNFGRVVVAPWVVREADAVPCTVMADVYNEN